jgi:hypothetical protein
MQSGQAATSGKMTAVGDSASRLSRIRNMLSRRTSIFDILQLTEFARGGISVRIDCMNDVNALGFP